MKNISKLISGMTVVIILSVCSLSCSQNISSSKKLDKEELKQTLELKISMETSVLRKDEPIHVKLEFIGHPEFYRARDLAYQQFSILPDVDILREANTGMGILLELYDESGNQMFFKDEDVWMRKVKIVGMKDTEDHVYRKLKEGVLETVELPLSEWIDFKKAGKYILKVYYQVFDGASFWQGPVTSNELMFQIFY